MASIAARQDAVSPTAGLPIPPVRRSTVAVLAFAGMAASFMQTVIVPIQSELPDLLREPRDATAWVVTATLLSAAVVTPVAGRLGDLFGKRRVMLWLLGLLMAGSVVAALSPNLIVLVVGRALQGTSLGLIPLGISLLRDLLPPDRLPSAVALVSATLGIGGSLGPPLSALVSQHFDWHMLFVMTGLLALILFVLIARKVPDDRYRSPGRFDVPGTIGLAIGLTGVLVAVSQGHLWGWSSSATLVCGIGGLVVLGGWGWFELHTDSPVVDLRVAARRQVILTNLASIAMGFALFSGNVAFPQILELPVATGVGLGLSLIQASLILMPAGLLMMLMSPVTARLTRTVGPRILLAAGAGLLVIAYLIATVIDHTVISLLGINLIIGLGIGIGYSAMPSLIMKAVPASETAAANGLNTLMRGLGTSLAAALVGAQLAAHTVPFGPGTTPTATGFQISFITGGVVALVGCGLALAIPRARTRRDAVPALSDATA